MNLEDCRGNFEKQSGLQAATIPLFHLATALICFLIHQSVANSCIGQWNLGEILNHFGPHRALANLREDQSPQAESEKLINSFKYL